MFIPVIMALGLVGLGMYFFVLKSVSEFADEQIKESVADISGEIYDICDENFLDLMQSGKMDDRKTGVVKKAVTLGIIEEYARQNDIGCRLTETGRGELLRYQIDPDLREFIEAHHLKEISSRFQFKGRKYYFQHFDFNPWGWHIGLVKDTKAYAPLIERVKLAYSVTGMLLVLGLVLILLVQERFLRKPLARIITAMQTGQVPDYKGIYELEFLSDNISEMMHSLEERNKWVESLYLIAITNRGKDFFQLVAQALSDALGLNILVLRYNQAGNSFHLTAFSGLDHEPYEDFAGLPGAQILAEKRSIIVTSGACLEFPLAPCLTRINAQTYAGIPVFDRGEVVIGTMNLFGEEKHFTQWDLNLIQTACRMVAVEFEYLAKEKDKAGLEVQLQQAQKMEAIGTLAGGIAHDFNNILFPVLGHTEILLEDIPEDTPIHDRLKKIYKGSIRARDLVKQILTFSRQERFELKTMQLQPVIHEALKFIRSTIPTTIDIVQDIRENCSSVRADATQIHQIVMNLATNAAHAMDNAGGKLKVSLEEIRMDGGDATHLDMKPGSYVCLRVADTGTGIDKELIGKIFDPFFTTKAKGKGTGMGLSVVHGIVDQMNGSIQAFSEPGRGTEFKVYFPVEHRAEGKEMIQTGKLIRGRGEKILLIDDEADIVSMEEQVLERLGYQVVAFTESTKALKAFCKTPDTFDMIITDMAMPGMSGDRLAAECLKKRPDIPILLCTGFSDSLTEEKMLSQGIRGFLSKPMGMGELAQKIHEVLDSE